MTQLASSDQQADSRYKQMWMHERNRRIEVEQDNIRLRKIVYNTKFSINERAVALEIAEQVKDARHVDEQGRKLFSPKIASEKLGLSRGTISTAVDILAESGFIKDKDTKPLRDKEGKLIKGKGGKPISTIHLDIEQDLYEDFSQVERSAPRKIGEDRKKPTFQCQKCLSENVTIETSRHLVCRNPDCKACGEKVLIDVDYHDQHFEEPAEEFVQNLDTKELLDNSVQNLDTKEFVQNLDELKAEDESNKPTHDVPASLDHDTIIRDWLNTRRGSSRIIIASGKLDPRGKYTYADEGYQPDLDAYIAGNIAHIYGSRLSNPETGLTQVLCFEIDKAEQDAQAENYLLDLSRAGAAAVYWQRYAQDRRRGHLELYFSEPVDPEVARQWAIEVCPDLEEIPEVYPCKVPQDKQKQGLSWPMYQRIGNQVYPCQAKCMLPKPHDGGLQECDPTNKESLARLITVAVTPAALVEEFATVLSEREKLQSCEKKRENAGVCFIGISPKPVTQVQSDRDLREYVIAEQRHRYSWDDIADMAGGWDKGFFKAVWRSERTASVKPDKDGRYACDYGNHGSFPKKLDTYGAYCLIHGIDQKADIAERCAQLRRQQSVTTSGTVDPNSGSSAVTPIVTDVTEIDPQPATELFPIEQKQGPVPSPCIVCGNPKNVWDPELGTNTCGTSHL